MLSIAAKDQALKPLNKFTEDGPQKEEVTDFDYQQ